LDKVLSLKNIIKNFGGIEALKSVNFELQKGEVHALLGENGAGKSTLIKIVTGVYQPTGGEIFLNGKRTTISSPIDARRQGIAAIYQELSLIESLTVAENIFLGNEPVISPLGIYKRKELYKKCQDYLDKFGIHIDSKMMVSELGMGQKRIIEIVKALVIDAKVLLLDEPTTGMSGVEIEHLFEIMEVLKKHTTTMIYISHYLDEIFRICDRITVLRDGKLVALRNVKDTNANELIIDMIGRDVEIKTTDSLQDSSSNEVLLEVMNFKTDKMKVPVNFAVKRSEILGITGIVGAGKSELAQSLFGAAKKISGEMLIKGTPVCLGTPHDAKKLRMAFVPEDRKKQGLFLGDSVEDNLVITNLAAVENQIYLLSSRKKRTNGLELSSRMHIQPLKPELMVGNLSGGNQQKVVIGKWLADKPELIIMDEPTRGIDIHAKSEIYDIVRSLASGGSGVLIFTSEYKELLNLCSRILVLYKGNIAKEVSAKDTTSEQLLLFSLGG
jgi:ABC-type sugar transport system ATPase subunit